MAGDEGLITAWRCGHRAEMTANGLCPECASNEVWGAATSSDPRYLQGYVTSLEQRIRALEQQIAALKETR